MRVPLVVGNWKMFTTPATGAELAAHLARDLAGLRGVEVVVAPPFTSLAAVGPAIQGKGIHLAAQDLHWEEQGAFTGAISRGMLEALGCLYVIVGHSERRKHFGETDQQVNRKVQAALSGGLRPILCVGEEEKERSDGRLREVIGRQVSQALEGYPADSASRLAVAYEPVWAIGTGKVATVEQAREAHRIVRATLDRVVGPGSGAGIAVLYGGSVNAANAPSLFAEEELDGALVGGASLEAASFWRIIAAAG